MASRPSEQPTRPLVALRLPAGPAFLPALQAQWDAGRAVLPLPADLPPAAVRGLLRAMRPAALLDAGGWTSLDGGVPVAAHVAVVVTTSGSTGAPKGVELSAGALDASVAASLRRLGASPADRWLCCLPPAHVGGLAVLLRARALGTEPVVQPRFDPAAVASAHDATHVSLVPTMLRRLLDAGVDVARFRAILLGGGPAAPALLARAAAAGATVVVTYGMSETCGGCVYDGRPLDGVEVALDGDGRIRLRGPVLFSGYRLRPDLSAAALAGGWYVTADRGRFDAAGRLQVLGRADDVVVSGGANVSLAEVEALLASCPGVGEVAVTARADPEWGQRLVAVVVPDGTAPTLAQLRRHVRDRAAAYKAPRELVIVPALPRLSSGKVDRAAL